MRRYLHNSFLSALFLSSLATLLATAADSWTPVGPPGATVVSLEYDPFSSRRMLAGTYFGGVYESLDDGATWRHLPTEFGSFSVFSIAFDRSQRGVVYAGTFLGGVFRSEDGGKTWSRRNSGLTDLVIQAIAIDPTNSATILAVTGSQLVRSTDAALTWSVVDLGEEKIVPRCLLWDSAQSGSVYLGTQGRGVFRSANHGATWTPFRVGMGNRGINSLSFSGGSRRRLFAATSDGFAYRIAPTAAEWSVMPIWPQDPFSAVNYIFAHPATINVLFAGTGDGAYLSRDNGTTWTRVWKGGISVIRSDLFATRIFFAGGSGGLHMTQDLGRTWRDLSSGLQNVFVGTLAAIERGGSTSLLAGTEYGVFSASGQPVSWSIPTLGLRVFSVHPVPGVPERIFAGTEAYGVWKSDDAGESWKSSSAGLVPNTVYSLEKSGVEKAILWAGTSSGLYFSTDNALTWNPSTLVTASKILSIAADPKEAFTAYFGSFGGAVFRTSNGAQSLENVSQGLPNENILALRIPAKFNSSVFAVTSGGGLYLSENRGDGWAEITPQGYKAVSLEIHPEKPWIMYLGTAGNGVLKTESSGIEWREQNNGIGDAFILALAIDPRDPDTCYAGGRGVLFKTTDGGGSWSPIGGGLPAANVVRIVPDPDEANRLFVSVEGNGVYRSEDGGQNWKLLDQGFPQAGAAPVLLDPQNSARLFAGSSLHGIFVSEDHGDSWQPRSENLSLFVRGLATDAGRSDTIYAGSLSAGFFRSEDGGGRWTSTGLRDDLILAIKANPKKPGMVYAATTSGILRSEDRGDTWRLIGQRLSYILSICSDPRDAKILYIGGANGSLLKSVDGGRSWLTANRGLPPQNVTSIVVNPQSGTLHAAVEQGPIYRSDDGGESWSATPNTAEVQPRVAQIEYDPATKAYYAATSNAGVLVSLDGLSWAGFNEGLASLGTTAVIGVPGKPGVIIAATGDAGIYRSDNGGAWVPVGEKIPSKRIAGLRAFENGTLIALAESSLYESTDHGETWTQIGGPQQGGAPSALFTNPFRPETVYLTTATGGLQRSDDQGKSWQDASSGLPSSPLNTLAFGSDTVTLFAGSLGDGLLISRDNGSTWSAAATPETIAPFVLVIAVDSARPDTLYAGTSGGVIKSTDGGERWAAANGGLPKSSVLALAIDPSDPEIVYAGTAQGVYVTSNGGARWSQLEGGMFHTNVTALTIDPRDPRIVYAGTEGGGVFKHERR